MQICDFMKSFPMNVHIHGRRRDWLLNSFSRVFPLNNKRQYSIKAENISVNPKNANEQLMYYFFYNVLRGYEESPLGVYLNSKFHKSNSDSIFVDIGANLGFYGLLAKILGHTVLSFEPDLAHFALLDRNKGVLTDQVYNLALSCSEGEADFYSSEADPGGSSLVMSDRGWDNSGYETKTVVSMQRFDQVIIDESQLCRIGIVKIDVEGEEANVVEGMIGIFEKGYKPEIWCEVRGGNSDRNPNSYLKVINIVKPYGYKPYVFTDEHVCKPFSEKNISQVFDILLVAS